MGSAGTNGVHGRPLSHLWLLTAVMGALTWTAFRYVGGSAGVFALNLLATALLYTITKSVVRPTNVGTTWRVTWLVVFTMVFLVTKLVFR